MLRQNLDRSFRQCKQLRKLPKMNYLRCMIMSSSWSLSSGYFQASGGSKDILNHLGDLFSNRLKWSFYSLSCSSELSPFLYFQPHSVYHCFIILQAPLPIQDGICHFSHNLLLFQCFLFQVMAPPSTQISKQIIQDILLHVPLCLHSYHPHAAHHPLFLILHS